MTDKQSAIQWAYEIVPHTTLSSVQKNNIKALADVLLDSERSCNELVEALSVAADLLMGEGYDNDPDYSQEWKTISDALASSVAAHA